MADAATPKPAAFGFSGLHPRRWTLQARLMLAFWGVAVVPTLTFIGIQNWCYTDVVEQISNVTMKVDQHTLETSDRLEFSMRHGPVTMRYQTQAGEPGGASPPPGTQKMRKVYRHMMSVTQSMSNAAGLIVMLLAALAATLLSLVLSRKIARPIETERQAREAELTRVSQELEIAATIQAALLPTELGASGYDLALAQRPAAEVGGDLLDYLPQPDGTFWLAVGDVTGHGLNPGLISMMAQSVFAGLVTRTPGASPATLLNCLNEALYRQVKLRLKDDNHMSLQLLRHEGDGRFVAAGHHADVLVYRAASGRVERLEVPGVWVGLLPDVSEHTVDVPFSLAPGDVLLLYTDGLVENKNAQGEQYDLPRLEAALARHAEHGAEAIKQHLLDEVCAWLSKLDDDLSLLVLKRLPVAAPVAAGTAPRAPEEA